MAGDEPPPVVTNAKRGAALAAVVLLFIAGVTLAFRPVIQDGDTIAIRSVHTGKYLALGSDGKLRASAATSSLPAARFRLVALTKTTVATFRKRPVAPLKEHGKLGCDCTGETDEHGFGRYCHNWESEFHRPWCYVNGTSCKQGLRSKRHSSRHLQEEGYLGPEGWEPAAGCACSGRESVHGPRGALTLQTHPSLFRVPRSEKPGFGGFCRGWEFVGQTPWCYTNNDCPDATGPEGANKHGFGSYCKGWELEGQTPWCYAGGSFAHRYIQCTEVQNTLSKLLGRRLQSNGPAATARSKDNVGLEWAACTATPPILKAPRAIEPSLASAHHRKLLVHLPYSGSALSMQKVAAFELVRLSRT
ncbi:hypothetical protein EMIHUDRAFT_451539 [Emiliania huxleyi CCMP1516]|uniref:Kringle domain-containing protein n=2 Tax=Emiliania huxleyi TaxID=2903 RepID=A0A0D3IYL6_EMIH1|nr:hypothetical protein EMIHUDRAFT_451539 [Emiliania huxleyi CCMP1516]EOD16351.1 hypothetical protein EMIHUDRAFT_451539 [Emiliania huxleyi CCMP1516]|eukprot:XP_005768780.1 hypothetical protein EMIHUDRAFT_451539 [Emiliania huxleyi CCMP1516]